MLTVVLQSCDASSSTCICTSAIEASLQACVNCAVQANFTEAVIASAQNLTRAVSHTASQIVLSALSVNTVYDLACSSRQSLASPRSLHPFPQAQASVPLQPVARVLRPRLGQSLLAALPPALPAIISQITIRPSSTTSSAETTSATSTNVTSAAAENGKPRKC